MLFSTVIVPAASMQSARGLIAMGVMMLPTRCFPGPVDQGQGAVVAGIEEETEEE